MLEGYDGRTQTDVKREIEMGTVSRLLKGSGHASGRLGSGSARPPLAGSGPEQRVQAQLLPCPPTLGTAVTPG